MTNTKKTSKKTKINKRTRTKQNSNQKTTTPINRNPHIEFKGFLSFLIMHELNQKTLAGEDLAKKIGKRKGTTLTPGTIYPALKKLKSKRLIIYEKQGRRKVYSLTPKGKDELTFSYSLFSKYFYGLKNKIRRKT